LDLRTQMNSVGANCDARIQRTDGVGVTLGLYPGLMRCLETRIHMWAGRQVSGWGDGKVGGWVTES
jgi:hypothetical protein